MSHVPQRTMMQNPQPGRPHPTDTQILVSFLKELAEKLNKTSEDVGHKIGGAAQIVADVNDRWASQLVTQQTWKYIDIDSLHRNRTQYPLTSNFVIPYTNAAAGSSALNSYDPVSLAFPALSGLTQGGSTTTTVVLALNSPNLDNFCVNNILGISGVFVTITNYVAATQTATITPALAIAPGAGAAYTIRYGVPLASGILQAGSTQNSVVLPSSFSTIDGTYVGSFFLLNSGPAIGQNKVITSYIGATRVAVLGSALTTTPGTDDFELDGFSYDNLVPLRYSGSRTISQPVCWAISLLQLTIPNLELSVGYGGKISNYPYLYVHFYNETKHTETTMYGNNPPGTLATFRVAVDSVVAAAAAGQPPNFFVFDNINIVSPQSIKFSPSESVRFRVTLPMGEDLQFISGDTVSPARPNPQVQISALIALNQLVIPPKIGTVLH